MNQIDLQKYVLRLRFSLNGAARSGFVLIPFSPASERYICIILTQIYARKATAWAAISRRRFVFLNFWRLVATAARRFVKMRFTVKTNDAKIPFVDYFLFNRESVRSLALSEKLWSNALLVFGIEKVIPELVHLEEKLHWNRTWPLQCERKLRKKRPKSWNISAAHFCFRSDLRFIEPFNPRTYVPSVRWTKQAKVRPVDFGF